ncbi:hypothetical protein Pmani_002646 [Petrolisthes manimaculis]|uniref:Uncharacterized protein n=1 Tax=Petrolisthes manimaculis TaxID=1843537 RepID=A0AAE1QI37_9EUCA|nr:hypothetical protein Pmani_002646 [Petrolisthes manimaculis]
MHTQLKVSASGLCLITSSAPPPPPPSGTHKRTNERPCRSPSLRMVSLKSTRAQSTSFRHIVGRTSTPFFPAPQQILNLIEKREVRNLKVALAFKPAVIWTLTHPAACSSSCSP